MGPSSFKDISWPILINKWPRLLFAACNTWSHICLSFCNSYFDSRQNSPNLTQGCRGLHTESLGGWYPETWVRHSESSIIEYQVGQFLNIILLQTDRWSSEWMPEFDCSRLLHHWLQHRCPWTKHHVRRPNPGKVNTKSHSCRTRVPKAA